MIHQFVYCISLLLILTSCQDPKTDYPLNACKTLDQGSWYRHAARAEHKWGVPIEIQLAIIYQESGFQSNIRPPKKYVLGIIPWGNVSSAYGYAQALNPVWGEYMRERGGVLTRRTRFKDAVDFIGWYLHQASHSLGISKNDAFNLYMVYHEGISGYKSGSYKKNKLLNASAKKVQDMALLYKKQLADCRGTLRFMSLYYY